MTDSKELAIRDSKITCFDYHEGLFREFFTSPYEQYAPRIGQKFSVVEQLRPSKEETETSEAEDDMYKIRFEDGEEISVFGHEVCQLIYEKCKPVFES